MRAGPGVDPLTELAADYDFIEHRADAILAEMVAAVRAVVASNGLSFFRESEDGLREVLFDEFLTSRLKVSEEAIEAAGYEVPVTKYVADLRKEREEVSREQGAEDFL